MIRPQSRSDWQIRQTNTPTDRTEAERIDLQAALNQYHKYPCATTKRRIQELGRG